MAFSRAVFSWLHAFAHVRECRNGNSSFVSLLMCRLADATTLREYTCIEELFFLLTDAANGDENARQLAIPKVVFGALWNLFGELRTLHMHPSSGSVFRFYLFRCSVLLCAVSQAQAQGA